MARSFIGLGIILSSILPRPLPWQTGRRDLRSKVKSRFLLPRRSRHAQSLVPAGIVYRKENDPKREKEEDREIRYAWYRTRSTDYVNFHREVTSFLFARVCAWCVFFSLSLHLEFIFEIYAIGEEHSRILDIESKNFKWNWSLFLKWYTRKYFIYSVNEVCIYIYIGYYYKIIGEFRITFGIKKRLMGTVMFTRRIRVYESRYLLTELCRS